MASYNPKMSTQGTAGNRKHVILMFLQEHEIIRKLEGLKGNESLWLSTSINNEPFMIQGHSRTNYDHLWHQVEV
jgi:hypothetical protein